MLGHGLPLDPQHLAEFLHGGPPGRFCRLSHLRPLVRLCSVEGEGGVGSQVFLEGVSKFYGGETALADIHLAFTDLVTTAVVGPSGSGKSTLLQLINGLIRPTRGKVSVFGNPIDYERLPQLRLRIGYAVQGTGLFPHLTVWENITLLARLARWEPERVRARGQDLMRLVDLPLSFERRYPYELSGGQQQRVGLCRAMILNPKIFLLDEPFGALDPMTRNEIHQEFLHLQKLEARTMILVTHDLREAPMALAAVFLLLLWPGRSAPAPQRTIVVGSKHFNEGYILSEILAQLLEDRGFAVDRKFGLGGTLICFDALRNGGIDLYPEYSGTLEQAVLKLPERVSYGELRRRLKSQFGLDLLDSFGFSNTYAIAVSRNLAEKLGLKRISDLSRLPGLRFGFSLEFLNRQDGWPGLARTYGLTVRPSGIEHGLAYQAIRENKLDLTDVYSTDGDIRKFDLILLEDDRHYFPDYLAAPLVRADVEEGAKRILGELAGTITETEMQELNGM
ncbi:MAG: ATP-binding cassette domain-containing protein, partial [Candidatus Tectomicrobia bacterium]|nr:ATP-binding cassette domain-containing protein [Candidatus Tectomicrobia bacterium]